MSEHLQPKSKISIQQIDILRGIAIMCVFLYHCQIIFFPHYITPSYNNYILDIKDIKDIVLYFSPSAFGASGVNLFLLISGFLIHLGYLSNPTKFSVTDFYKKRFWRIYPAYLFVLFFFCFSKHGSHYYLLTQDGLKDLFYHALLIHNLSDNTFFSINSSFWSLALEVQLYLIYPIFLYARIKLGIVKAFFVVLFLSLSFLTYGFIDETMGNKFSYNLSVVNLWFIWCAGAVLAEKYFAKKKIFHTKNIFLVLTGFALFFLSRFFLFTSYFSQYFATFAWLIFFEWFLVTRQIGINNPVSKLFTTIGICSYSIYLIHQPFLADLISYFNVFPNKYIDMRLLKLIPSFMIIFLVSYSLYIFVEMQSVKIGSKFRSHKFSA